MIMGNHFLKMQYPAGGVFMNWLSAFFCVCVRESVKSVSMVNCLS